MRQTKTDIKSIEEFDSVIQQQLKGIYQFDRMLYKEEVSIDHDGVPLRFVEIKSLQKKNTLYPSSPSLFYTANSGVRTQQISSSHLSEKLGEGLSPSSIELQLEQLKEQLVKSSFLWPGKPHLSENTKPYKFQLLILGQTYHGTSPLFSPSGNGHLKGTSLSSGASKITLRGKNTVEIHPNTTGQFSFQNLPAGKYKLSIENHQINSKISQEQTGKLKMHFTNSKHLPSSIETTIGGKTKSFSVSNNPLVDLGNLSVVPISIKVPLKEYQYRLRLGGNSTVKGSIGKAHKRIELSYLKKLFAVTYSNSKGNFEFPHLPPGKFKLTLPEHQLVSRKIIPSAIEGIAMGMAGEKIQLLQEDILINSALIRADGRFSFPSIPNGKYQLKIDRKIAKRNSIQRGGVCSFHFIDSDKNPLRDTTIKMLDPFSKQEVTKVITDQNGSAVFKKVPTGKFLLKIEHQTITSYQTKSITFNSGILCHSNQELTLSLLSKQSGEAKVLTISPNKSAMSLELQPGKYKIFSSGRKIKLANLPKKIWL